MIALSNLAFPADAPVEFLARLKSDGLSGIEVAPTRLAPWEELSPAVLGDYRSRLSDIGLSVPSLQALLFAAGEVALLGDEPAFDRLVEHLRRVVDAAGQLGAGVGVFGSPRQRSRGALAEVDAFALGAERFRRLAETCWSAGRFTLGLEPVPAAYGGDFLVTAEEVIAMVDAVDHPGLRVHLDTGCVMLGQGKIADAIALAGARLVHFHAAEPKLATFEAPVAEHEAASMALRAGRYGGWVSIEMLQAHDWQEAVRRAVKACRLTYRPH